MTKATLVAVALAVCAVSIGAQIPTPTPAPVPLPPTAPKPGTTPTPAPWGKLALPPEMPQLPELPELPDLPDLADLPDFPDMPDLPEMPDLPDVPDMSEFGLRLEGLHDMEMDLRFAPLGEMDFDSRFDFDRDFDLQTPAIAPIPPFPPMAMEPMIVDPAFGAQPAPVAALDWAQAAIERIQGQSPFERQFGGIASNPPQAWAQSDPADSLYRLARETLNRGEYRRAAQLFSDITQRFPNSVYAADARYWRAFALYRIGGTNDLRDALRSLQDAGPSYRQASLQADAAELAARIRGALAEQGDRSAVQMVSTDAARSGDSCDREDQAVRIEALKSLGKTDPESTTPILRRVLARRDDCSASLRRAALYLLGKRKDPEAMSLVAQSARTETDAKVRADALRFLAAMPGDHAISTLEEIARTPGDESQQRSAIAALGRSDSPRARQSLRAIVERTDLSESLRASALASIDNCECGGATDNGPLLRSLYPRLETTRLKASALRAIARSGGKDNEQWLLTVIRNQNEPVEVRAAALRYAGASSVPIADLVRMYDVTGDRPLRVQLISLYSQRNTPESNEKLIEIAKKGTDPDMRRMAISALSRKNDPRTRQLLLEIIDK